MSDASGIYKNFKSCCSEGINAGTKNQLEVDERGGGGIKGVKWG